MWFSYKYMLLVAYEIVYLGFEQSMVRKNEYLKLGVQITAY